jgi:hypothetical protein
MGCLAAADGIPFAVEGSFFLLDAIFVAICIHRYPSLRTTPSVAHFGPVRLLYLLGTLLSISERRRPDAAVALTAITIAAAVFIVPSATLPLAWQ